MFSVFLGYVTVAMLHMLLCAEGAGTHVHIDGRADVAQEPLIHFLVLRILLKGHPQAEEVLPALAGPDEVHQPVVLLGLHHPKGARHPTSAQGQRQPLTHSSHLTHYTTGTPTAPEATSSSVYAFAHQALQKSESRAACDWQPQGAGNSTVAPERPGKHTITPTPYRAIPA